MVICQRSCSFVRGSGDTYTTVGMVDGVHGNTTSLGPAVTLDGELVLGTRSLCKSTLELDSHSNRHNSSLEVGIRTKERLVGTATTSDNTNHSSGVREDDLLGAGGELDAGLALIGVVADNGDVVAGGSAQSATVTDLLLDVGDDGTLGHLTEGKDVADGQGSLLSGVDELAGVHAFIGDESLGGLLESVGVAEDDLGQGSTSTCTKTINVSRRPPNIQIALPSNLWSEALVGGTCQHRGRSRGRYLEGSRVARRNRGCGTWREPCSGACWPLSCASVFRC